MRLSLRAAIEIGGTLGIKMIFTRNSFQSANLDAFMPSALNIRSGSPHSARGVEKSD